MNAQNPQDLKNLLAPKESLKDEKDSIHPRIPIGCQIPWWIVLRKRGLFSNGCELRTVSDFQSECLIRVNAAIKQFVCNIYLERVQQALIKNEEEGRHPMTWEALAFELRLNKGNMRRTKSLSVVDLINSSGLLHIPVKDLFPESYEEFIAGATRLVCKEPKEISNAVPMYSAYWGSGPYRPRAGFCSLSIGKVANRFQVSVETVIEANLKVGNSLEPFLGCFKDVFTLLIDEDRMS